MAEKYFSHQILYYLQSNYALSFFANAFKKSQYTLPPKTSIEIQVSSMSNALRLAPSTSLHVKVPAAGTSASQDTEFYE